MGDLNNHLSHVACPPSKDMMIMMNLFFSIPFLLYLSKKQIGTLRYLFIKRRSTSFNKDPLRSCTATTHRRTKSRRNIGRTWSGCSFNRLCFKLLLTWPSNHMIFRLPNIRVQYVLFCFFVFHWFFVKKFQMSIDKGNAFERNKRDSNIRCLLVNTAWHFVTMDKVSPCN